MLDKKVPVKLSLSIKATFTENVRGFNVVAEIPGSDPALSNQVVMLGGHLDSWHTATGATDNGAGCAAAIEAVRMLQRWGEAATNRAGGALDRRGAGLFRVAGIRREAFRQGRGRAAPAGVLAAGGILHSRQRERQDSRDQPAGQ